jgi:hypothetical protein
MTIQSQRMHVSVMQSQMEASSKVIAASASLTKDVGIL